MLRYTAGEPNGVSPPLTSVCHPPENTRRSSNAGFTLARRPRRRANAKPALVQRVPFSREACNAWQKTRGQGISRWPRVAPASYLGCCLSAVDSCTTVCFPGRSKVPNSDTCLDAPLGTIGSCPWKLTGHCLLLCYSLLGNKSPTQTELGRWRIKNYLLRRRSVR